MNVLDKAGLIRLWTHIKVALNQMLTQAKESGEFDGESVTITDTSESTVSGGNNVVTFSDGTVLTIKNGTEGSTPVRGEDYWTEEDKAEIKSYVDEAILGGDW